MANAGGSDNDTGIEVVEAFTPLSESELKELDIFAQHMSDLEDYKLAKRTSMKLRIADGGRPAVEDVEKEQVEALMSAYRKVALLQNERGTFSKVCNILGRHASDRDTEAAATVRGWLKALKDMRKDAHGQSRVMAYVFEKPDGTTEQLAPATIIDWLVNGVISHSDSEARGLWDRLGGWSNGVLLMNVLVTVADDLQIFRGMNAVVREVLDAPALHATPAEQ